MSQTRQENSITSIMRSMVIGGVAGATEVLSTGHILWSWKTRRQKGQSFTFNPKVLYRGVMTNIVSMVPITAVQFISYNFIQSILNDNLTAAFISGVGASLIACPVEMGMAHQGDTGASFTKTCKSIITDGGMKRLYTGLPATAFRDGVFTIAIFTGKSMVSPYMKTCVNNEKVVSIASGVLAGVAAGMVTHGADTVKTVQQASKNPVRYTEVAQNIYKKSGIPGFYHGGLFRNARIGLAVMIMGEVKEKLENKM